jgi:hypothetical protein
VASVFKFLLALQLLLARLASMYLVVLFVKILNHTTLYRTYFCILITLYYFTILVWEMTARQLAKGKRKFRVASKIHRYPKHYTKVSTTNITDRCHQHYIKVPITLHTGVINITQRYPLHYTKTALILLYTYVCKTLVTCTSLQFLLQISCS